jgi:hypothetical protein
MEEEKEVLDEEGVLSEEEAREDEALEREVFGQELKDFIVGKKQKINRDTTAKKYKLLLEKYCKLQEKYNIMYDEYWKFRRKEKKMIKIIKKLVNTEKLTNNEKEFIQKLLKYCSLCGKFFNNFNNLMKHLKEEHGVK